MSEDQNESNEDDSWQMTAKSYSKRLEEEKLKVEELEQELATLKAQVSQSNIGSSLEADAAKDHASVYAPDEPKETLEELVISKEMKQLADEQRSEQTTSSKAMDSSGLSLSLIHISEPTRPY